MNTLHIRQYLAKDPDLSREGFVKLTLAEGPSPKEKASDPQLDTIWVEVSFWLKNKDGTPNPDGMRASRCSKGDRVDVEGRLSARKGKQGDKLFFELKWPKFNGVYAKQEEKADAPAAAPAGTEPDPFGIPF